MNQFATRMLIRHLREYFDGHLHRIVPSSEAYE
jgi:hypothetical protein